MTNFFKQCTWFDNDVVLASSSKVTPRILFIGSTCTLKFVLQNVWNLLLFLTSNCDGAHADRPEGFGVGPNTLVNLLQARKYEDLRKLGGVRLVILCSMYFLSWSDYKGLCSCARLNS